MLNTFTLSIQEVQQAICTGSITLAELAIRAAERKQYSASNSFCEDAAADYQRSLCLYLYLYAAEDWCSASVNVISNEDLISIISKIEELR